MIEKLKGFFTSMSDEEIIYEIMIIVGKEYRNSEQTNSPKNDITNILQSFISDNIKIKPLIKLTGKNKFYLTSIILNKKSEIVNLIASMESKL